MSPVSSTSPIPLHSGQSGDKIFFLSSNFSVTLHAKNLNNILYGNALSLLQNAYLLLLKPLCSKKFYKNTANLFYSWPLLTANCAPILSLHISNIFCTVYTSWIPYTIYTISGGAIRLGKAQASIELEDCKFGG